MWADSAINRAEGRRAGMIAAILLFAACSPSGERADAHGSSAKAAANGCPKPTLVLDDKGNIFRDGFSIDNASIGAGVAQSQIDASHQVAEIATAADGTIWWNCEKITQAELDKRFVAARLAARQAAGGAPAAPPQPVGLPHVDVRVGHGGVVAWNGEALTLVELQSRLQAAVAARPRPELHITPEDASVSYEDLSRVMKLVQASGLPVPLGVIGGSQ